MSESPREKSVSQSPERSEERANGVKDRDMSRSPSRSPVRASVSPKRSPRRVPTKSRSRSRSRRRSRSQSPVRGRSRSPVRARSRSPVRARSRSPVRGRSRSPVRGRSRSPVRARNRSLSRPPRSLSRPRRSRSPAIGWEAKLDRLYDNGILRKGDIDSYTMDALTALTSDLADCAMNRFCEANFSRITNKSGFLMGIIRRVQEDGPDTGGADLNILPRSVKHRMRDLIDDGRLAREDIDVRMCKALADLPTDQGLEAVDKFASANLDSVRSKTGFMMGIIKRVQADHRGWPRAGYDRGGYRGGGGGGYDRGYNRDRYESRYDDRDRYGSRYGGSSSYGGYNRDRY